MTEVLTLIGERLRVGSSLGSFPADIIVGIETPDGEKSLMRTGDPRYPRPHEIRQRRCTIALGELAAGRLTTLFSELFVEGQDKDYDCNAFPLYIAGEIDELRRGNFRKTHSMRGSIHHNALEGGRPYAIESTLGATVHTMIATDSLNSLSLMGRSKEGGGLMMRVANPHLVELYSGVRVGEITRINGTRLAMDL